MLLALQIIYKSHIAVPPLQKNYLRKETLEELVLLGWHVCRTILPRKAVNSKTKVQRKVKREVRNPPRHVPKLFEALFSCLRVFHRHFFTVLRPQLQTRFQLQFQTFFIARICRHGHAELLGSCARQFCVVSYAKELQDNYFSQELHKICITLHGRVCCLSGHQFPK